MKNFEKSMDYVWYHSPSIIFIKDLTQLQANPSYTGMPILHKTSKVS